MMANPEPAAPMHLDTPQPPADVNQVCHDIAHSDDPRLRVHSIGVLISTLLNLEHPVVTPNMVRFLRIGDVRDTLLSFVHRLPETASMEVRATFAAAQRVRSRDPTATRHSYRTAQLLMYPVEATFDQAVQTEVPDIIRALFKVFHPQSEGNFYHTRDITLCFLRKYTGETLWALAELGDTLLDAMCYLDYAPVGETILGVLAMTPDRQFDDEVGRFLYSFPAEALVSMLVEQLISDGPPGHATRVRDWIVSLVNELNHNPMSLAHQVFVQRQPLLETLVGDIVARLVDPALPAPKHVDECLTIVHCIATASTQAYSDGLPRSIEGTPITVGQIVAYSIMNAPFLQFMYSHALECTHKNIRRPKMTPIHITIMDLMLYIANHSPTQVLAYAPPAFMKLLVQWFFRNRHSNIYHGAFVKVFELCSYSDQHQPLQALLEGDDVGGGDLLLKMVQDYMQGPSHTCYRGHVLRMCNLLLGIEAQDVGSVAVQEYIQTLLKESHAWQEFQPTLQAANDAEKPRYDIALIGTVTVPEHSEWANELNVEKAHAKAEAELPADYADPASPPAGVAAPSLVESPEGSGSPGSPNNTSPRSPVSPITSY